MIEQAKFTCFPLRKQTKAIEDQVEKQIKAIEEHGKQLVESNALVKKIMIVKKITKDIFSKKKFLMNLLLKG